MKMAPKQPEWAFLESLAPDDLEEDDTEKVSITATNLDHLSPSPSPFLHHDDQVFKQLSNWDPGDNADEQTALAFLLVKVTLAI